MQATDADSLLPIREVVLFSSGVAFSLREGDLDAGETALTLTFRTTQINDILKSLVLLDAKGTTLPATYASRDPVGRRLGTFAVDVSQNRTRADLLRDLRGTPVSVTTTGDKTLSGRIVGVETRSEIVDSREIQTETLTLLGDDGLAAIDLPKIATLLLLDERLDQAFRDALVVLASSSDDQRRAVTLRFSGKRKRPVRVGYITEAPLWKISYRLVLDDAAKPYLQGWALVENTSDADWNGIRLSLVSGRPVSFIQDLYQPRYVSRPVVGPDDEGVALPQLHAGTLDAMLLAEDRLLSGPVAAAAAAPAPPSLNRSFRSQSISADAMRVAPQAEARAVGELFRYDIATPVSLAAQQAAMIPIVSQEIDGEKLSLYNADTDARFPRNAVRLKNNTGLHLKSGPVTIFDGGVYAGDARTENVPAGDSRLLTYAVDLAVDGERQTLGGTRSRSVMTMKGGVLTTSWTLESETRYTFRNKARKVRTILVEHPFASEWTLVSPAEPTERTAQWYRFTLKVPAGATRALRVIVTQPGMQSVSLLGAKLADLIHYADSKTIPEAIRSTVAGLVERRRRSLEATVLATQQTNELNGIYAEQERMRQNMSVLDRESALYKRYVDELDLQETRISELRAGALEVQKQVAEAERALQEYIDAIDIDGVEIPEA